MTPQPQEPSSMKELRSVVQRQLNAKYCEFYELFANRYNYTHDFNAALAVGESQTRVPYKLLKPEHVIGIPPGITLRHPSNMCRENLEAVYENILNIKFIGKLLYRLINLHAHSLRPLPGL